MCYITLYIYIYIYIYIYARRELPLASYPRRRLTDPSDSEYVLRLSNV